MKVASIETFTQGHLCLARVRTDDGAEGIGQRPPLNAEITATVVHRQAAPHVLGSDPADIDALADRWVEAEYKFPGSYICRSVAGLDTALWDLRADAAGHRRLGVHPRRPGLGVKVSP